MNVNLFFNPDSQELTGGRLKRRIDTALLALAVLAGSVEAGIGDCASGYRFDRMSGVGCVQDRCADVSHAFYSYVGYCVCYACGEAGCSGDKAYSKECRRPHDYKSCPGCLYACIGPGDKCPGEKDALSASGAAATEATLKAQSQASSDKPSLGGRYEKVRFKGRVTAFGKPLKHIRLYCADGRVEATTDENGNYEFEAEGLGDGEEYSCEVRYEYVRNDRTYFQVHSQDDTEPAALTYKFKVDGEEVTGDMGMERLMAEDAEGYEAVAAMYVHMTEALEFYIDGLKEDLDFQLPLHVHGFMPDDKDAPRASYNGDNGESNIYLQARDSVQGSPDRQIELYHEFSHYVMHALYGRWPHPEGGSDIKERNHGGFLNPSTSDTYVEAFAVFMSVAMMEAYGETVPSGRDDSKMTLKELLAVYGNSQISNLEEDYKAWDRQGRMEEYAGAGILWDLVDGEDDYNEKKLTPEEMHQNYLAWRKDREEFNEYTRREFPGDELLEVPEYTVDDFRTMRFDDDRVQLDFEKDVWPVLRTYHSDFTDVYKDIVKRRPDQKAAVDEVFIRHGFFHDDKRGNGIYDEYEPYDDANGNGERDDGERFIDLSAETPAYRQGQTIGSASNYQRPLRHTPLEVPGQYVRVGNDVPFYRVLTYFPRQPHLTSTYRARNVDGRIYVNVPPAGYNATLVIVAEGVETGHPLTLSAEKFNREYGGAAKRGYYVAHDFKVRGEIPAEPKVPVLPRKGSVPGWLWLAFGGTVMGALMASALAAALVLLAAFILIRWRRRKR